MSDLASEDLQVEILLVFGSSQEMGRQWPDSSNEGWYWMRVWRYLVARYPDMLEQRDYPDGDEHDMRLLKEIHCWQIGKNVEVEHETQ